MEIIKVCKKIISNQSSREIDSCLLEELETLRNTFPGFKEKFRMIMSCCGHRKYPKTLIVQNNFSKCYFEWFSGVILSGDERSDNREPFYKRDSVGYYFIPSIGLIEGSQNNDKTANS